MVIVHRIIEPLSIMYEHCCEKCGAHYRSEVWNQLCPRCLVGDQKHHAYRGTGSLGTRAEQREKAQKVVDLYNSLYPELGRETANHVGAVFGMRPERVRIMLRKSRAKE